MQENQVEKSKIHTHSTVVRDAATGKQKLPCNYCPKAYAYAGGNTSSMLQHFRGAHRDREDISRDFPACPEKSKAT